MHNLDSFLTAAGPLRIAVNRFSQEYNASQEARIDHFCYKCGSRQEYLRLRAMLEVPGFYEFSYQSEVARRPISLIKLKKAFITNFGSTHLLELSDQKPDGSQKAGFDHVELLPQEGVTYGGLVGGLKGRGAEFAESGNAHHPTYDLKFDRFKIRLTSESLLDIVIREIKGERE